MRAREVRCLHATVETDLRGGVTLVAARRCTRQPRALLRAEEPFARADEGWAAASSASGALPQFRRATFAKENVASPRCRPDDPPRARAGSSPRNRQPRHEVEWNEGLVVALAPADRRPARWSALVESS